VVSFCSTEVILKDGQVLFSYFTELFSVNEAAILKYPLPTKLPPPIYLGLGDSKC
jgi:hypothetical protein